MRISDWSSDVCSSDLVERGEIGADRAFEHGGVRGIEHQAFFAHQLAGVDGFLLTRLGNVDIDPASEAVVAIPLALAVAHQHEFAGHFRLRLRPSRDGLGLRPGFESCSDPACLSFWFAVWTLC